jgi:hypothetical protein
MNDMQRRFVEAPLERSSLMGIPGGGKTRSIIEKVRHHNKVLRKPGDCLILTFSRASCADFIAKGSATKTKMFNARNIRTIHSLAGSIAKGMGYESKSISTVIVGCLHSLAALSDDDARAVLRKVACLTNVKVVIVDEAQDLSDIQYQLVSRVAEALGVPVIMVGDPNQNIYQFQKGSDQWLLGHSAAPHSLVENYRASPELVAFANHFRPWTHLPSMKSVAQKAQSNTRPRPLVYCETIDAIMDHVLLELRNGEFALEDIAIIGPVKLSKPLPSGLYLNMGLQYVVNRLEDEGIKYVQHYTLNGSVTEVGSAKKQERTAGHVNLLTCHGSKGLEFKKTLVVNFHLNTFGRPPSLQDFNNFRYLWYVALTRAEQQMVVYVTKGARAFPALADCPPDMYDIGGLPLKLEPFDDKSSDAPCLEHGVTKFISDLDVASLYEMESIMGFDEDSSELLGDAIFVNNKPLEFDEFATLYGMVVENVFAFFCCGVAHLDSMRRLVENVIELPHSLAKAFRSLRRKSSVVGEFRASLRDLEAFKNVLDQGERGLYSFISDKVLADLDAPFKLVVKSKVQNFDSSSISAISNERPIDLIFRICLFVFHIENEAPYLMQRDFSRHIASLAPFVEQAQRAAVLIRDRAPRFQVVSRHPNLPLRGCCDVYLPDTGAVIELKFSASAASVATTRNAAQLLLYYNNMFPNSDRPRLLEVWNLFDMSRHAIHFAPSLTNWSVARFVCSKLHNVRMRNSVFVCSMKTDARGNLKFRALTVGEGARASVEHILELCARPTLVFYYDDSELLKMEWNEYMAPRFPTNNKPNIVNLKRLARACHATDVSLPAMHRRLCGADARDEGDARMMLDVMGKIGITTSKVLSADVENVDATTKF